MKIIIAVSCNKSNKRIRTQTTYESHLCQIVGYFTDYFHPVSDCWLLYWWIPSCVRSLVTLLMNSLLCQIVGYLTDYYGPVSDCWLLYWWISSCVKYCWLLYWWKIVGYFTDEFPPMSDRWLLYWWIPYCVRSLVT